MPMNDYSARHEKKPFDKAIYDVDDNAKHLVIAWLKTERFDAWVNPDTYGIDLLATRDGNQYGVEVEVKHNWSGATFPYDKVHFAARKLKFTKPNALFAMLNNERTHVLVTDATTMSKAPIVVKSTKYTNAEEFVEIDVNDCIIRML